MLARVNIQKLKSWAGFVGIFMIIAGILCCFSIVGIVSGILTIVLGVKLLKVKKCCNELLNGEREQIDGYQILNKLIDDMGTFFKIQGIYIIIGLVLTLLVAVGGIIAFVYLGMNFPSVEDLVNTSMNIIRY